VVGRHTTQGEVVEFIIIGRRRTDYPSSALFWRRPQDGPPFVGVVGCPRGVGRHGRTPRIAGSSVKVLAILVDGAGRKGCSVLPAGVLLLEPIEIEFCAAEGSAP
jgi:hypothetical protein